VRRRSYLRASIWRVLHGLPCANLPLFRIGAAPARQCSFVRAHGVHRGKAVLEVGQACGLAGNGAERHIGHLPITCRSWPHIAGALKGERHVRGYVEGHGNRHALPGHCLDKEIHGATGHAFWAFNPDIRQSFAMLQADAISEKHHDNGTCTPGGAQVQAPPAPSRTSSAGVLSRARHQLAAEALFSTGDMCCKGEAGPACPAKIFWLALRPVYCPEGPYPEEVSA
jgi:hypothetical protein